MSSHLTSQHFVRLAAVALVTLVLAIALIQSWHREDAAVLTALEPGEAAALVAELARCRTVTSDEASGLEACRRLWAENRQRFFASKKSTQLSDQPAFDAAADFRKSQERIPQREVDQRGTR